MGRDKDRTASHGEKREEEEEKCNLFGGGCLGFVEETSWRKEDEALLIETKGTMEKG
jgi:hypothetical protein